MQTLMFTEATVDENERYLLDKEELMRVKVWVCRAGQNAHGMPILEDALDKAITSLRGKALVAEFSHKLRDLLGHTVDEIPVGVFLSDEDIFFENDDLGQRWICGYATIWTRYAKDVAFVMNRDKIKSVSMEMLAETNDNNEIVDFYFVGVTLIGVEPAIPMARAELLEFSELSSKIQQLVFSSNKKLGSQFEHTILNGSIDDKCKFAKSEESNQDTKHFEEGGTSLKDEEKMAQEDEKEVEMSANENVDATAQADTLEDEAKQNEQKSEEFIEEKMSDESELEGIGMAKDESEDEEKADEGESKEKDEEDDKEDFAKVKEDFAKLKEEHTVLMSELESLRQFKAEYDENQKKFAVEETMSAVSDVMPTEMASELRVKGLACDFSELTAWSNEVKAKALDFARPTQKKDSHIKIGLTYNNNHNTQKNDIPSDSIWGKL